MNNVFMGALPEMDGGYRDAADGSEGRVPRYSATNSTSTFNATGDGTKLYSPPSGGDVVIPYPLDAENKPQDSPADTTSPIDVTKYKSDVTADTDQPNSGGGTNAGGEDGDETGTKISPALLLAGVLTIYFVFFRKKS